MNKKRKISRQNKSARKNVNINHKLRKKTSGAPWGNMSFEAILNSETPQNHLKKKKRSKRSLNKRNKHSKKKPPRIKITIPK